MPACDDTGSIFVDDASRLAPGTVLYAEGVGFLTVVQIVDACEVVVRNDCPNCDLHVLDPGQPVAEGTLFVTGIPVCVDVADSSYLGPRLASDYFIPAVSNCVQVAVTSIEGLAIGDTVSINNNRYVIDDIPDTESIVICNEGEGGSPGTLVEADPNSDGIFDYPILRISTANPCTEDPVDAGKLIVCEGSVEKRLEGSIDNQVPAWNKDDEEFQLKVISGLALCVTLDSCLIVDPEADACQDYLIEVAPDTTRLAEELAKVTPNPLRISIEGVAFCMTEVVNSTTIRVIPDHDVVEIETYDTGDVLCVADCCEQCTPTIQTLDKWYCCSTPDGYCHECEGEACELLMTTGVQVFSSVPDGITVITFPSSLAANGYSGFEEDAESFWKFDYINEGCCDCRKYVEITSNFEVGIDLPADVFANVELRILKTSVPQNSQAFAAQPFVGGRAPILSGIEDHDLLPSLQTINSWKGVVYDRDFVGSGETGTYKGHIRIVIENTTGGPVDIGFLANWRVWLKAWDWACATIENVELPTS